MAGVNRRRVVLNLPPIRPVATRMRSRSTRRNGMIVNARGGDYAMNIPEFVPRAGSVSAALEQMRLRDPENKDDSHVVVKIPQMKSGGLVKKTGVVKLHEGEIVIPKSRVKSVEAAVKKAGLKPLKK